jgi:hypothetical protein
MMKKGGYRKMKNNDHGGRYFFVTGDPDYLTIDPSLTMASLQKKNRWNGGVNVN